MLASSVPYEEWELFDLDRVNQAFKIIVQAAVSTPAQPVQVLMKHETATTNTPRVVLVIQTQQNQGQRFILNPSWPDIRMQPRNVWFFNLSAEIITNREQNGVFHYPLVAKTRLALQFYKLALTWTMELEPLHAPIDIGEEPCELTVQDVDGLDSTKINFTGMLQIRDTAWIR